MKTSYVFMYTISYENLVWDVFMYTISYENLVSAVAASRTHKVVCLETYTKSTGFLFRLFIVYRHHQNWKLNADF